MGWRAWCHLGGCWCDGDGDGDGMGGQAPLGRVSGVGNSLQVWVVFPLLGCLSCLSACREAAGIRRLGCDQLLYQVSPHLYLLVSLLLCFFSVSGRKVMLNISEGL